MKLHQHDTFRIWQRLVWGISIVLLAAAARYAVPVHAEPCVYTVRSGDTLSGIAQRFNTTVERLAVTNGIRNVNLIYVNQRIVIPVCGSSPAAEYVLRLPSYLQQDSHDLRPIPAAETLSVTAETQARRAAVRVLVSGLGAVFQGTGSVIGKDGDMLLTAYHVVARPTSRQLRGDTIQLDIIDKPTAELVDALPSRDLALLRLSDARAPTLPAIPVGESDALRVGDTIYVVGYPAELEGELSFEGGVIIDLLTAQQELRYIVTNAYAGQGSSGGLAVNQNGELIGIVDALITNQRLLTILGYPNLDRATVIIPISQAIPLLKEQ